MVTFMCPQCGQERTYNIKRCYECTGFKGTPESAEKNRQASLRQQPHTEERRRKNSEWHKVHAQSPAFTTAGLQPHNWRPVGSEGVGNGHIIVKCDDGKWRYRARLMWADANGPIPKGMLIHHINEDPFDDRLENFEMVTRAEHARLHADPDAMRERGARARRTN